MVLAVELQGLPLVAVEAEAREGLGEVAAGTSEDRLGGDLDCHPAAPGVLVHGLAEAEAGHLQAALTALDGLAEPLADYQPYHAARAEYLARAGRTADALEAYATAITHAASPADAAFLTRRRDRLRS